MLYPINGVCVIYIYTYICCPDALLALMIAYIEENLFAMWIKSKRI